MFFHRAPALLRLSSLVIFLMSIVFASAARAEQRGMVSSVNDKDIVITADPDWDVGPQDFLVIYTYLPELDTDAIVGGARVASVTGTRVTALLNYSSGAVVAGQFARLNSLIPRPQKAGGAAASNSAPAIPESPKVRGWAGFEAAGVNDAAAKGIAAGALVIGVWPESPAAKAGLRSGDVIQAIDGEAIPGTDALESRVRSWLPGRSLTIELIRDGAPTSLSIALQPTPDPKSLFRKTLELAVQNQAWAQLAVGRMFLHGEGTEVDPRRAFKYVRSAAEDLPQAQVVLGEWYMGKDDVLPRDPEQALGWFRRAAAAGDPSGEFHVGLAYHEGNGVAPNSAEARKWLDRAEKRGSAAAQNGIGVLYYGGDGAENKAAAVEWFYKAALQGLAAAQYNLGMMCVRGIGVQQDYQKGADWLRLAAAQDDADALNDLGILYQSGQGVPLEYQTAIELYHKAASMGHASAAANLGYMCAAGLGVQKDYDAALGWFRMAASWNDSFAMNNLGWLYENGLGVPRDQVMAIAWYLKASEAGSEQAKTNLLALGIRQ